MARRSLMPRNSTPSRETRKEDVVEAPTSTPSMTVVIGRRTYSYHAFVTTAPAACDAPATLTLYASTLADVSGMAAVAIPMDAMRARAPARLVLVDATELWWQRARSKEGRHLLTPADPVLVGFNTLQHWLWERLAAPLGRQDVVNA
jgi:hypothetical protein